MRTGFIIAILGSFAFSAGAFGQNWLNPAGGSWGTPSNWDNDGAPYAPNFNLNSAASYTTSLPQGYFVGGLTVETDNVTVDLNNFSLATTALTVADTTGQTGSLTLVGPGSVVLRADIEAGSADVGDQGGTGQLVVNDATITNQGETGAYFHANGLIVENGGSVSLPDSSSNTVTNATLNDGVLSAAMENLSVNQVALTNGSSISAYNVTLGSGTLDHSGIGGSNSESITGIVTLSDHASTGAPMLTISGTLDVLAGTSVVGMDTMTMQNGTLSVELNGAVSGPISRPTSISNGILDLTLQAGFEPNEGEQFQIFNPVFTRSGTFATVNYPALPAGEFWDASNLYTNGTISVVPEPMSVGMLVLGMAGLGLRRRENSKI